VVKLAFTGNHQSPERADDISRAVTKNILDEGLSYIEIENVQDCVQEELMRQGNYKIAEAYILYLAKRAKLREMSDVEKEYETTQEQRSINVVKRAGDDSFLYDGSELCKRIAFASAGLDSHLTFHEIFSSLREGISSEISISGLKKYVVRNAQRLIEKDPVLAIFAAIIQLLYLYEDIFDWNCSIDTFKCLNEKQGISFVKSIETAIVRGLLPRDMLK
jgi:ribonucleoside-diphosphate reductase alpha chain